MGRARELWEQLSAAMEKHDDTAVAELYATESMFLEPNNPPHEGRTLIRAYLNSWMQAREDLDITVEQAMTLLMSAGMVQPGGSTDQQKRLAALAETARAARAVPAAARGLVVAETVGGDGDGRAGRGGRLARCTGARRGDRRLQLAPDQRPAGGHGAEPEARHHSTSRVTRSTSSTVVTPARTLFSPSWNIGRMRAASATRCSSPPDRRMVERSRKSAMLSMVM